MADEKSNGGNGTNGGEAPKEAPSPTTSHSEPSAVHSEQAVPPLAKQDEAHKHDPKVHSSDAHGSHDSHDAHGHDSHGHGHGDAPTVVGDFGEVIPEKNWQDSLLASLAFCVLGGFIWLGLIWFQLPEPPAEAAHGSSSEAHEASPTPQLGLPPGNPENAGQAGQSQTSKKPEGESQTGNTTPTASETKPGQAKSEAAAGGSAPAVQHAAPIQTAPKTPDNTKVRNSSQF